ncbi:MAG: flagellar hook-length control protein FliK [Rhodocyclaceae bacterium]|nr:flagellar hook-length control protein FliK [Rhodocyclaceae bacterium]
MSLPTLAFLAAPGAAQTASETFAPQTPQGEALSASPFALILAQLTAQEAFPSSPLPRAVEADELSTDPASAADLAALPYALPLALPAPVASDSPLSAARPALPSREPDAAKAAGLPLETGGKAPLASLSSQRREDFFSGLTAESHQGGEGLLRASQAPMPLREEAGGTSAAPHLFPPPGLPTGAPLTTALSSFALATPPSPLAPPHVIEHPLGAPGWADAVGQRLAWFAREGQSHAELTLTPPQLGRIEIHLTLADDASAQAQFATPNPLVREALEAALPRLREALAEAGIALGQTHIGAEFSRPSTQGQENPDNLGTTHKPLAAVGARESALRPLQTPAFGGRGLIDVFV